MHDLPRHVKRIGPGWIGLVIACPALVATVVSAAAAGAFARSAHGDPARLPRGCGSCHVGHGVPRTTMLPASVNDTCLSCHGDAARRSAARAGGRLVGGENLANVASAFNRTSRHRLGTAYEAGSTKVACSDCHRSHYVGLQASETGRDKKRIKETADTRSPSQPAYRVCYRCHGAGSLAISGREEIERLFKPANPSYHPVEALGKNRDVPSLVQPYDEQSYVACTDCHGNDQAAGARGPHGSAYEPILKAHFASNDGRNESAFEYALCYRCHNRNVVLGSSSFKEHRRHVRGEKTSCRTCHNSHGSTRYPHLIDFDTKTVFANSRGLREYRSTGIRRGDCSLRCHGKDHDRESY